MEKGFAEVVQLIQSAKQTAVQWVNAQLVDLYWKVGAYISQKLEKAEWGDGIVPQLAAYLAKPNRDCAGLHPETCFGCASFMRLTAMRKTDATGVTITLDAESNYSQSEQTARRTGVLHPSGDSGEVVRMMKWWSMR